MISFYSRCFQIVPTWLLLLLLDALSEATGWWACSGGGWESCVCVFGRLCELGACCSRGSCGVWTALVGGVCWAPDPEGAEREGAGEAEGLSARVVAAGAGGLALGLILEASVWQRVDLVGVDMESTRGLLMVCVGMRCCCRGGGGGGGAGAGAEGFTDL